MKKKILIGSVFATLLMLSLLLIPTIQAGMAGLVVMEGENIQVEDASYNGGTDFFFSEDYIEISFNDRGSWARMYAMFFFPMPKVRKNVQAYIYSFTGFIKKDGDIYRVVGSFGLYTLITSS
ncbi:MAG: hypothetical protein JSW62_04160 [Thermoplasmatales archaeon]|nr:MAG: hypothetical protein JSW62_04160 [Thermoplasmatales archaeon]